MTTRDYWQEQAEAVEQYATALAKGRVIGPRWAAVKRLRDAADTLLAWTDKDGFTFDDVESWVDPTGFPNEMDGLEGKIEQQLESKYGQDQA